MTKPTPAANTSENGEVRCPTCDAVLVPVVYGMPGGELFEAADRGEVILGGCIPGGPALDCVSCRDRGWGGQRA